MYASWESKFSVDIRTAIFAMVLQRSLDCLSKDVRILRFSSASISDGPARHCVVNAADRTVLVCKLLTFVGLNDKVVSSDVAMYLESDLRGSGGFS